MHMPTGASEPNLPPAPFDDGCATGVKGVIADARAFQMASRTMCVNRPKSVRRSILAIAGAVANGSRTANETDEEAIFKQWRESRQRELVVDASRAVRRRRTIPSMRMYGRLDEVDALGYLDAIEKVSRETKVVVFVSNREVPICPDRVAGLSWQANANTWQQCDVSATIESALLPLVKEYPTIRFVQVHYDEIEFDPAAVPSLLAYRNQGDLFAHLTEIIKIISGDEPFSSNSLKTVLSSYNVI
ncbi:hypothetical protein HIM_12034 [Hirsutella minnesotensis 3608]|uniref:Phosducin thioredoxin-like domain-containing protein n=1 Tax=Hirsutella minnesotensis 3608 TaxID=1043627 RepID=A0A0F7ZW93_9HYPO|nr:hypothetical protein HIM_12034 [Hirsutella minnesotensis 3608]